MKQIIKVVLIVVFMAILLKPSYAQKEGEPIAFGEYRKIFSNVLNEDRLIFIKLPEDYSESKKRYPVIYELDGCKNVILRGMADTTRLQSERLIQEVIYVSIVNTDRNRDMFPFRTHYHPTSGGANTFLEFISEELVPYVNTNFRTTSYRTITGFSASAMFVIYTLVTQPETFDGYIACSPSLSFDTDYFIRKLKRVLNDHEVLKKILVIVYGSAEGKDYYGDQHYFDMMNCVREMTNTLKHNSPRGFNWNVISIPGGKHVPFDAAFEGLKKVFEGWQLYRKPEIIPAGGFYDFSEVLQVLVEPAGF